MSKLNPRDQIDKASAMLVEAIKDAVNANLAAASSRGQLDVKGDVLVRLLALTNASIEEGYHRANRSFGKSVELALVTATFPKLDTVTSAKKKSG